MYKVLIADDEPKIRRGISESIPWEEYGLKVVGLAKDGEEALEIAISESPDICLIDINMPVINGLELIKSIKEENPEALAIIITGFDLFDYAQQALKLKAFDYLLKPINEEELKNTVLKAVEELNRIRELNKKLEIAHLLYASEGESGYMPLVRDAKNYIETHYMNPDMGLAEIADMLEVSTGYLSRIFKQYTGLSFTDYLKKIKITESIKLINNPSLKIYEVAEQVGYSSQHYFCYAFKKVLGISPSEYRQKGNI